MMAYRFLDRALWQMPVESAPEAGNVPAPAHVPGAPEAPDVPEARNMPAHAQSSPEAPNAPAHVLGAPEAPNVQAHVPGALETPDAPAPAAKPLSTNGVKLFFDAIAVLGAYREEPDRVVRALLHSVLHCLFRHPLHTVRAEPALWELACDICVEAAALELCRTRFALPEDARTLELLRRLGEAGIAVAPAPLYRALLLAARHPQENPLLAAYAAAPEQAGLWLARDGHGFWDLVRPGSGRREDGGPDGAAGDPSPGGEGMPGGEGAPDGADAGLPPNAAGDPASEEQLPGDPGAEQTWRDIAQQVATEMRSMSEQHGDGAGNLASNLELANRSAIDYESFLRRFSMPVEEVKTNDEEFDYIFYTYGLNTYGNMPIIEPLEYREAERLREFVVAVDTSGSCSGELVRTFVTRTCEILGQAHLSGEGTRIHIVQADAAVQDDTVIATEQDLRAYIRDLQVLGGGGTDFRPVFEYIDELRAQGQLRGLRGMVYFTDGFGTFPSVMPDYDVAFAFVEDEGRRRTVPPWAMKVVLGQDDIEQLGTAGDALAANLE